MLRGLDDPVVQAYYDYMVDLAVLFGADRERAKEEYLSVLEFETNVANVRIMIWTILKIIFVFPVYFIGFSVDQMSFDKYIDKLLFLSFDFFPILFI